MVNEIETLRSWLGPEQPAAQVAIEACREAWHVHDLLRSWGNEVVLVDTTRSRRLGIGQHGRKTERIDAEVLAHALEQSRILYEQMLGRATRLCPVIGKESFRIFDAVALYEVLEPVTQMKAV